MKTSGHIIDNVRWLKDKPPYQMRRGSVLMEFIIVFPIYLVLLGGVFMVGDMSLRSIMLAPAERVAAHDVQKDVGVWNYVEQNWWAMSGLFKKPENGTTRETLTKEKVSEFYADLMVQGPWSLRAAVKAGLEFSYGKRNIVRAWLGFADHSLSDMTQTRRSWHRPDHWLEALEDSSRILIHSKTYNTENKEKFNYLTLKRTRYDGRMTWRDNRLPANVLVDAAYRDARWHAQVYEEKYHYDNYAANREGEEHQESNVNHRHEPAGRGSLAEYQRYTQFVRWSE